MEFDYFTLGQWGTSFSQTSPAGDPILARPFFNVQTNEQASELVAYPGVVGGTVAVGTAMYFQSAGATLSYNLCSCNSCCDPCDPGDALAGARCEPPLLYCCRTDLLVGLRYYNLSDRVGIHEGLSQTLPTTTTMAELCHPGQLRRRQQFLWK